MRILSIISVWFFIHNIGMASDLNFADWPQDEMDFEQWILSTTSYDIFGLEKHEALSLLADRSRKDEYIRSFIANDLVNNEAIFSQIFPDQILDQKSKRAFSMQAENRQRYLEKIREFNFLLQIIPNCELSNEDLDYSFGIMNALSYLQQKNLYVYETHPSNFEEIKLRHYFSHHQFSNSLRIFFDGQQYSLLAPHKIAKAQELEEIENTRRAKKISKTTAAQKLALEIVDKEPKKKFKPSEEKRYQLTSNYGEELARINQLPVQERKDAFRLVIDKLMADRRQNRVIRYRSFMAILGALKAQHDIDTTREEAEIYLFLGRNKIDAENRDCTRWFYEVIKLIQYKGIDYAPLLVAACIGLGHSCMNALLFKDALTIYKTTKLNDPTLISEIYYGLGYTKTTYEGIGPAEWFFKAIEASQLLDDEHKQMMIGRASLQLGNIQHTDKEHPFHGDWYLDAAIILEGTSSISLIRAYIALGCLDYWDSKKTPAINKAEAQEYWLERALLELDITFETDLFGTASSKLVKVLLSKQEKKLSDGVRAENLIEKMKTRGVHQRHISSAIKKLRGFYRNISLGQRQDAHDVF